MELPFGTQQTEVSPMSGMTSPSRAQVQIIEAESMENKRKVITLQESNQRLQKCIQTLQEEVISPTISPSSTSMSYSERV